MWRQITPSLCKQSERHGYIMTIIIIITTTTIIISTNYKYAEKLRLVRGSVFNCFESLKKFFNPNKYENANYKLNKEKALATFHAQRG